SNFFSISCSGPGFGGPSAAAHRASATAAQRQDSIIAFMRILPERRPVPGPTHRRGPATRPVPTTSRHCKGEHLYPGPRQGSTPTYSLPAGPLTRPAPALYTDRGIDNLGEEA